MLNNKEINLDLPVDAYDAEGNPRVKPSSVSEEPSTEVSQTEEKDVVIEEKDKTEDGEQRVPYSRFSKKLEENRDLMARLELAEQRARDAEERPVSRETKIDYNDAFAQRIIKLYGDNDISKEIIEIERDRSQELEERAEQRAIEAIEKKRIDETKYVSQNEDILDSKIEALSASLGRDLTSKEEESLLGIVDEFTQTGEDGNYVGEILSFDKAWEIHELRQSKNSASSKAARNKATVASGGKTAGETSVSSAENDKNFNPMNWRSLYDRIK